MTLRAKISIPLLLVSGLLVAFLYGHWMPAHLAEQEAELRDATERHLASVAESFIPLVLGRQLDALYENLDALKRRNADWVAIELSTPEGGVLYPLVARAEDLVPGLDERVVRRPIAVGDRLLGQLTVKVDVGRRLAEIRRRHGQLVVASLLVLVAYVGLILMVLERGVRRPLHLLAHASKRLAAGEFDTPLDRAGSEEVTSLVDSFAGMRESIRGYQAELLAKNDSLTTLSLAVTQSPIAIAIVGRDGLIEYVNPRFLALTGETYAEAIGRPCRLLDGSCVDCDRRGALQAAIEAGEIWRGEVSHRRKSGEPFQAVAFLAPVRDERGAIVHWLAVFEDITQQRALELQLVQAQKMEALGTLAGGIAHDFNNVLSPIIGYTELARGLAEGNPELSEDLANVSEAALRARDLVRQILTFSRKAEKRKVPLEVAPIAAEALKLMRSSIPATIEIRQRYEGEAQVLADPTQVHQVVMNLCTNAFHAMEPAGGVLAVSVSEVEVGPEEAAAERIGPGRHVVLAVSDTGRGMDRETQARIFDPYFTTKEPGKGTGLGLSVVDGIVRDHGGGITVYSEPGVGTTFRVYLPVTGRAADAAAGRSPLGPTTRGERVLFVDDEEPIRAVTRRSLAELGYGVEAFASGGEALAALQRDPSAWDLLVTDMTMAGMNGIELARRAVALRPDLPVILCSGYSGLVPAERIAEVGIRAYVEKPVVMQELHRAIQRVLGERPVEAVEQRAAPAA